MFRRRTVYAGLCLLATILVGTVVVLSSISYYLHIDTAAFITEEEINNATLDGAPEVIPRILHQTWKSETLPEKWAGISQGCRDMMPDYEYMLWTDASAREFIAEHFDWFLDTYDAYTYPIQRADSIRYFVLYFYGGIYLDLDIECRRPLDTLLTYPVILPRTIPVGVSNDLMFAEKLHPFMLQTIHNLASFDYSWVLNYPTVMFSTGPMFLSAQYGIYTSAHPPTSRNPGGDVRILPKSLYGKNAKVEDVPHSYFAHHYGSSWHADDAAFIGFLGKWGKGLMWVGLVILILGIIRLALAPHVKKRKYGIRRIGGYEVMMPRWIKKDGRWHLHLGSFAMPPSSSSQPSSPTSPSSDDEEDLHMLPLGFDTRPLSPALSEASIYSDFPPPSPSASGRTAFDSARRAGNRVLSLFQSEDRPSARRPRRSRGVLFFLPALFTPSQGVQIPYTRTGVSPSLSSEYPPDKLHRPDDFECEAGLSPYSDEPVHGRAGSSSLSTSSSSTAISEGRP